MEQVAQMLGLELDEEFYIKDKGCKRKLTKDGMFFCYKDNWNKTRYDLSDILTGELEIIKIPKPILDEAEKRYLSAVIKPFRNRIEYIAKYIGKYGEYISIIYKDLNDKTFSMAFPSYDDGTMYKGMELDKRYSLEDLGL